MVARGWSPAERTRIGFYLVAGLLLALSPVAVQALALDEPRHQYRASEVTVQSDRIDFADTGETGFLTVDGVDGIGCSGFTVSTPWQCPLEAHVAAAENDSVTTTRYDPPPREPFVRLDSGYYRRVVEQRNDTTRLSYDPVSARTVLESVSEDVESARDPVARAVRSGTARSTVELETGRLVRDGDQYYYVSRVGETDGVPWAGSALGALAGLALLARGHQLRIERRIGD
jgi:hypothetical protein